MFFETLSGSVYGFLQHAQNQTTCAATICYYRPSNSGDGLVELKGPNSNVRSPSIKVLLEAFLELKSTISRTRLSSNQTTSNRPTKF